MGRAVSPTLPDVDKLRTPLTAGERRLLELFLGSLADEWEIYTQPFLNGCRPDFVLIHPRAGVAVVEVKDWSFSTSEHSTRGGGDPVRQIRRYAHELSTLYCPRMKSNRVGVLVTGVLVFTQINDVSVEALYAGRQYQYDDHGGIVGPHISIVGSDALLSEDMVRIIPNSSRSSQERDPLEPELLSDLRNWLVEPEYSAEQRAEVVLNARQREAATTRTAGGARRIKGPAGCGKSLVLCSRAANLARDGKSVLVVSFNRTLPNYLRDLCSRLRFNPNQGIVWLVYHEWLKRTMAQEGMEDTYADRWRRFFESSTDEGGPDHLLNEELPSGLVAVKGERRGDAYDAILVDEGQDFSIAALKSLRCYLKPGGEFLVAEDRFQDIYDRSDLRPDRALTGLGFGTPFALGGSYRLPEQLVDFLHRFASARFPHDPDLLPVVPLGQHELDVVQFHGNWKHVEEGEVASAVVEEAFDLIRRDNKSDLSIADLTILVPSKVVGRQVVRLLEAKDMGVKAVTTFATDGEGADKERRLKIAFRKGRPGVKVTTPHSFKGWEARLLVVAVSHLRNRRDFTLFYAAMSRLKAHPRGSFLSVVTSDSGTSALGRTFNELNGPFG